MMLRFATALALLALLPGCTDSLGIGLDCDVEMRQVRDREGNPFDFQRDEIGGNHTEVWYYRNPNRAYTFRWGPSFDGCIVSGPASFQVRK